MLADGGECVSDLGIVREQDALFGDVASDSTAFRMVRKIASSEETLEALRAAHAKARARFWELGGVAQQLTIDVDGTLIACHSEKEQAAGNYKGATGSTPCRRIWTRRVNRWAACCGRGTRGRTPLRITRP